MSWYWLCVPTKMMEVLLGQGSSVVHPHTGDAAPAVTPSLQNNFGKTSANTRKPSSTRDIATASAIPPGTGSVAMRRSIAPNRRGTPWCAARVPGLQVVPVAGSAAPTCDRLRRKNATTRLRRRPWTHEITTRRLTGRRKLEGFGRPNGESDRSRNRKRGVLTTFPPS